MSPLTVRPLSSAQEYDIYTRMADTAFNPSPSEEEAQNWQRFIKQQPGFRGEQVRGVFRDGQLMGGYAIYERMLQMGEARLSTGCIGGVVTSPDYRKQGVATALMQDAIEFAHSEKHVLLLLDGIAKFYYRYGYIDMFDVTSVEVNRAAILAQTPSTSHTVRPATVEDAPGLLDLYRQHYGAYTGSFERSTAIQEHKLRFARRPFIVVQSKQGRISGYLSHGKDEEAHKGSEIAANDWESLLALLSYHAHLFDDANAPHALSYRLPSSMPLTQWLIDTLELPRLAESSPANEWSVRDVTTHHRFAGWMARLTNFRALMEAILPELRTRWHRSLARWSGDIILSVAGEACMLRLDSSVIQLMDASNTASYRVELEPQNLVQLIFGYRPLTRLTSMAHLPAGVGSALDILFPMGHTWIPGSDWF